MANEIVETKAIEQVSDSLYKGVSDIIDNARQEVVVYVNKHSDLMFWHIGHYINEDMGYKAVFCLWQQNSCDTVANINVESFFGTRYHRR